MKLLYNRKIKFSLLFAFCFLMFSLDCSAMKDSLECRGSGGFEVADIVEFESNSTDSMAAIREYAIHAASSTATFCYNKPACQGATTCKKVSTGVGLKDEFPVAKPNALGYWEFPAQNGVKVLLKCKCKSTVKVSVIKVGLDGTAIDPLIGNEFPPGEKGQTREYNVSPDILIYPNPVRSKLNIDFKHFKRSGDYEIRIYNSIGTLMETIKVNDSNLAKEFYSITIDDYADGIYYLLVTDKSNVLTSSKFVVARE